MGRRHRGYAVNRSEQRSRAPAGLAIRTHMSDLKSLYVIGLFLACLLFATTAIAQTIPDVSDWENQGWTGVQKSGISEFWDWKITGSMGTPGTVVRLGGTYFMYYIGAYEGSGPKDRSIGLATSTNGVDFNEYNTGADPLFAYNSPAGCNESGFFSVAATVYDDTIYLYQGRLTGTTPCGSQVNGSIWITTSTDGTTFDTPVEVIDYSDSCACCGSSTDVGPKAVFRRPSDGVWFLVYNDGQRNDVCITKSTDGGSTAYKTFYKTGGANQDEVILTEASANKGWTSGSVVIASGDTMVLFINDETGAPDFPAYDVKIYTAPLSDPFDVTFDSSYTAADETFTYGAQMIVYLAQYEWRMYYQNCSVPWVSDTVCGRASADQIDLRTASRSDAPAVLPPTESEGVSFDGVNISSILPWLNRDGFWGSLYGSERTPTDSH